MVGIVTLLAGCGWHPLYARPSADPASGGTGAVLAQISVDPVVVNSKLDPLTTSSTDALYDSRAAQQLQNNLKTALNPNGPPTNTVYHLAVQLELQTRSAASLPNGQVTREDLVMTADYRLNNVKGETVLKDLGSSITSYDIMLEPFADISSRRDAQQKAAQELALQIQSRLAAFFTK
jgi:LPS-assembly lipoprotein